MYFLKMKDKHIQMVHSYHGIDIFYGRYVYNFTFFGNFLETHEVKIDFMNTNLTTENAGWVAFVQFSIFQKYTKMQINHILWQDFSENTLQIWKDRCVDTLDREHDAIHNFMLFK